MLRLLRTSVTPLWPVALATLSLYRPHYPFIQHPPAGAAAGVKRSHDGQPIAAKSGQAQLTEPALLAQLPRTRYGCCVVTLAEADAKALGFAADSDATGALTANAPVALVAWRARASINVLVGKPECAQVDDKIAAAQARLAQAAAK